MLSIVEYQDSSEESDGDEDQVGQATVVSLPSGSTSRSKTDAPSTPSSQALVRDFVGGADNSGELGGADETIPVKRTSLFASLPPPKSRLQLVIAADLLETDPEDVTPVKTILEVDDDAPGQQIGPKPLPTSREKAFKSVKITVPSLSEFNDDDDEVESTAKKPRMSSGGGLVACLPPPKNSLTKTANRVLIPYTLSKKPASAPPTASRPKPAEAPKPPVKMAPDSSTSIKSVIDSAYDDSDDDMEGPTDFFSLDKVEKDVAFGTSAESIAPELEEGPSHPLPPPFVTAHLPTNDSADLGGATSYDVPSSSSDPGVYYNQVPSVDDPQALLQDAGFLRLRGKKRGKEDIQIIDVSQDDQLPNTEEWMAKSLSEESAYRPSRKNGVMPTTQQRRKHQITYLAFQAKERELELKNQWAQNRQTKYQTQSKYGF